MRPLHLLPAALAAALSLSSAAIAAPSAKDKADARAVAADGRKALRDKRWADAIAALKKADRLDPSPALEIDLAQAQIGAGKLVEAQKTLTSVSGGTEATPAAKRAREAAKKSLDALQSRIPKVKVKVKGAPAGKVTTLVDGIEVDGSGEVAVNPGDHTIGAAADGFVPAEREVKLDEGGHEDLALELKPKGAAPEEEEKKTTTTGSRAPGAVLTAIGGAGLLAGGIFGALAFTATNNAKSQCVNNVCPASAQSDISSSKTYGNVSTGAFIGGGAVALTGIVLLIVAPGGGAGSDDAKSASGAPRFTPWVGPGGAGIGAVGRF